MCTVVPADLAELTHVGTTLFLPFESAICCVSGMLDRLLPDRDAALQWFSRGTERFNRPMLRQPDVEGMVAATVVRFGNSTRSQVDRVRRQDEELLRLGLEAGGVCCPNRSQAMSRDHWVRQYGAAWHALAAVKARYDPEGVLASGHDLV
jgi:hypothetical protein